MPTPHPHNRDSRGEGVLDPRCASACSSWPPSPACSRSAPGAAAARRCRHLQAKLAREMRLAGTFSGAYVRDLDTRPDRLRAPGPTSRGCPPRWRSSTRAATALLKLGPDATLPTIAVTAAPLDARRRAARRPGTSGAAATRRSTARGSLSWRRSLQAGGIARVAGLGARRRVALRPAARLLRHRRLLDRDIGGVLGALTVGRGFSTDAEARPRRREVAGARTARRRHQGRRRDEHRHRARPARGRSATGRSPPRSAT